MTSFSSRHAEARDRTTDIQRPPSLLEDPSKRGYLCLGDFRAAAAELAQRGWPGFKDGSNAGTDDEDDGDDMMVVTTMAVMN